MNCNPIPEREDWFITDRKPTICPRCGKKEVRKAVRRANRARSVPPPLKFKY